SRAPGRRCENAIYGAPRAADDSHRKLADTSRMAPELRGPWRRQVELAFFRDCAPADRATTPCGGSPTTAPIDRRGGGRAPSSGSNPGCRGFVTMPLRVPPPAAPASVARRLRGWLIGEIAALHPGCFALVMATGIISNGLFLDDRRD